MIFIAVGVLIVLAVLGAPLFALIAAIALLGFHAAGQDGVAVDLDGGAPVGAIPGWVIELILPVGFALLALRLAWRAFQPQRSDAPALAPELP